MLFANEMDLPFDAKTLTLVVWIVVGVVALAGLATYFLLASRKKPSNDE